jgi:hypothetical protein
MKRHVTSLILIMIACHLFAPWNEKAQALGAGPPDEAKGWADAAQASSREKEAAKPSDADKAWRSEVFDLLAVGMAVGDVDGDGLNDVVIIDPNTVYFYRMTDKKPTLVANYTLRNMEFKTVDTVKPANRTAARIYVTAQNRGSLASFALDFSNDKLVPVVENFPYYLRVITYPTRGPILLGQKKGLSTAYEGYIYRIEDKGDRLEAGERFGVPVRIPILGFCIGDFEGKRQPLIAAYDRDDHIRIYDTTGKRLYLSSEYYGGSDVLLRMVGQEERRDPTLSGTDAERVHLRPRIMAVDVDQKGVYQLLSIAHESKSRRLLALTKMLQDGRVVGLSWNGDALEQKWETPKIPGMVTDFAVDTLPGFPGRRLMTLERMKTDWLSFLSSKSRLRIYDLDALKRGEITGGKTD